MAGTGAHVLSQKPACMEFKELGVRIYGLSYEEREITEPLYEKILPEKRGIAPSFWPMAAMKSISRSERTNY
mgnify:CR=1 FL=1